jgi:hypothetical protein
MSTTLLKTTVLADGQLVGMELVSHGVALGHIVSDAQGLDELIRTLAKLVDQVPRELEPKARLPMERAPAWRVLDTHGAPGAVVLAIRHSGFGWEAFVLSKSDAEAMETLS